MKKILKQTLITINGTDCLELLVHNDCILAESPCDLCWYTYYNPSPDLLASCSDVHGCTQDINLYFVVL